MAQMDRFPMVPHMVAFFTANSVFCFLALIAVGLRLCSRSITRAGFGWDDGFTVASMIFVMCLLIVEGLLCSRGIGYSLAEIGETAYLLVKLIAVHNSLFIAAFVTNKIGILCFYLRIFSSSSKMRLAVKIVTAFCLIWAVISIISIFAGVY
ncbi:hypothetical protein F4677DRAFT_134465 [Hypoxylon crocopeplum]|nr:hypothetical protein F4677DRAFT_134465 [Hypoxylon crocopeplum]